MKYRYKDLLIIRHYNGYEVYLPTNNTASGNKYFLVATTEGTKKTAYNIGKQEVDHLNEGR